MNKCIICDNFHNNIFVCNICEKKCDKFFGGIWGWYVNCPSYLNGDQRKRWVKLHIIKNKEEILNEKNRKNRIIYKMFSL